MSGPGALQVVVLLYVILLVEGNVKTHVVVDAMVADHHVAQAVVEAALVHVVVQAVKLVVLERVPQVATVIVQEIVQPDVQMVVIILVQEHLRFNYINKKQGWY